MGYLKSWGDQAVGLPQSGGASAPRIFDVRLPRSTSIQAQIMIAAT